MKTFEQFLADYFTKDQKRGWLDGRGNPIDMFSIEYMYKEYVEDYQNLLANKPLS